LWNIDSSIEAICRFTAKKNIELFRETKVFTAEECMARETVMLNHYIGTVEIELATLIDMINQQVIPAVVEGDEGPLEELEAMATLLEGAQQSLHKESDLKLKAVLARKIRLETMEKARVVCDAAEAVCPADIWPICPYRKLMFIDQHYRHDFVKVAQKEKQ
jgi:glutamine synthetase